MRKLLTFFFILSLLFYSCKKDQKPADKGPTPYSITIPRYFPTQLNIPADNPLTLEGIRLGRYLFYDGRLSGRSDSLMSCCTCHVQEHSFVCGMTPEHPAGHPYGLTGISTPHTMLPMINLVWNSNGYLWNGKIYPQNPDVNYRNIENVVPMAILAPHEFNGSIEKTVAMIRSISFYPPMFKAAFGTEEITIDRISKAIAQFVRTLNSSDSRFDKYMRGELQLSSSELNGLVLFTTENGGDCFHCHGGDGNPLFTTNLYYNNGKDTCFTGTFEDPRDRYHVTGNPADIGAYRAPTLRNIEYTAPYMHDGRFTTLDEVLHFYNEGVKNTPYTNSLMHHAINGGVRLTQSQLNDLKAFLLSLSDPGFLTNPDFSKPNDPALP